MLSASLVLVNKYILTVNKFTYVYTLSLSHMIIAAALSDICLISIPQFRATRVKKPTLHGRIHAKFFVIGIVFALSLVCATQALTVMDIPSSQMLKTINPAAIYMMGIVIGIEECSIAVTCSIIVVCAGVAMTVYGAAHFITHGIILQLFSVLLDSARWAFLQEMMQDDELRLNSVETLSHIAPSAAVVLFAFASYFELNDLSRDADTWHQMMWVMCSSVLAFMLNVCSFALVRATSALNMSVTGVIKDVLLITISAYVFDTHVSVFQAVGYMTAVLGICTYNHYKLRRVKEDPKK